MSQLELRAGLFLIVINKYCFEVTPGKGIKHEDKHKWKRDEFVPQSGGQYEAAISKTKKIPEFRQVDTIGQQQVQLNLPPQARAQRRSI